MEQTWHWYSPNNPVSLADVHQAGTTGMVTTLHHIPNSEVWSIEEILKHKAIIEDTGLVWSVIESMPIHKDIKTHTGNYEQWITNYQQTLHNLAQCGIHTMCYNFMPVLNWTHTDLKYMLPDSSKALRFNQIKFTAFKMHILKHPGTEADYTKEEIAQAAEHFATMSNEDKAHLTHNIIAGLPGTEEGYTLNQFHKHLELYKDINKAKLRENFAIFLKAIIPVAEEVSMHMAVHPDNPPRPILSLPRIVSTIEDMQWMVDTINSMANSFTMCTSSYSMHADNNLVDMIKQFSPHIYFTHLRSTMHEDNPKTFHKAAHLNSDIDMYKVVKAIVEEEHHHKAEGKEDLIPMHPDHSHQMLDNLKKKTNPGYSTIGHLKGLAKVHSVKLAIQHAFFSH